MLDVLRFWFRRGVDGFRIDVIQLLAKRYELLPTRARPLSPSGATCDRVHVTRRRHPPRGRRIRRARC